MKRHKLKSGTIRDAVCGVVAQKPFDIVRFYKDVTCERCLENSYIKIGRAKLISEQRKQYLKKSRVLDDKYKGKAA